ncbi:UNVERIFIED_CONTAM: hypothetical protein PYX00_004046 [Menopon gallinae]|uniref:CUB domain-containing protein n=1 Tax=Menopon gallinae TaxID=328185 RepID=A0AAW2I444_9NEOP
MEDSSDPSVVGLDVRWPPAILSIDPRHIETYPDVAVTGLVRFLPTVCFPAVGAPVPETWLDLLSCGHSPVGCTDANSTFSQVVYSEQIIGYPRERYINLSCELFGIAGHFALVLRSSLQSGTIIETQNKDAFLKAAWSEQYIFNVHARSIFPCDVHGGGVSVLFQYPQCILKGDRVRLFSRLRADVSSLVPPTTLHYVTEQRVTKGKHSLRFDCDLFSERFVEYCFVYVSQAITGAVTDVRMDCVPTLPVSDSDSGGWGSWNPWSPCSTTCGGGTRNRFRYCDSPPPRYGAKFCQGPSVETERCGNEDWDCEFYQRYPSNSGGYLLPADRPEIMAEVGPGCRCGCVVHLGAAKPRRLLATSSQTCPGRIFWQIEADTEHIIRFSVENFRFPCGSQWLKVRDGDSRSSTLIGELSMHHTTSVPVTSTGSKLLIEFFSDELLASGAECRGGFLAQAQQSQPSRTNATPVSSGFFFDSILRNLEVAPTASGSLILVHAFVALFICVVIFVSGCLGIQYIHRYRKYQLAAAAEDTESMSGNSQCSLVAVRSRATSNSTLLSEVISLQRFKPTRKYKHSRLREEEQDLEEEHLSEAYDSQEDQDMNKSASQATLKAEEDDHGSTTASARTTPRASPASPRRSRSELPEEHAEKGGKPQSKSITYGLNAGGASSLGEDTEKSSLESSTSRGSGEALKKIYQLRRKSLSSSSTRSGSTITNGYDSPASSLRSARTRNPKETKDKRNLEKLLAGSEFSLPGDADLELDYYDYNVQNASAVPESYIGMDPAYLIWIPPYSPVNWEEEKREEEAAESATESKREAEERGNEAKEALIENSSDRGPPCRGRQDSNRRNGTKMTERGRYTLVETEEKETRVEKSPTCQSIYSLGEDLKFVDDDEDECKMENSKNDMYSGSNNKGNNLRT